MHLDTRNKVIDLGLDTKVGGPCYSVSYLYKNQYDNLTNFTKFIDGTNCELDFYSFHTYDYMRWDAEAWDFKGSVSSGLPLEGVFDAISAHVKNKYDKDFKFVGSEHGGYISDVNNKNEAEDTLANKYFPGSGFDHEMERRSISNFILVNSAIANTMTFMNHPHVVQKAVPFILSETSGWDPKYYSSLLVKQDFDKNSSTLVESRLIDFYKFFKDVRGRRIESFCHDGDIQHFAFVDDKTLILLFHNQSNTEGTINANIDEMSNTVSDVLIRRVGRKVDFRPEFSEETVSSLGELTIKAQESVAVFVKYENIIPEEEDRNEEVFYSPDWDKRFTGSRTFDVKLPAKEVLSATLRVGISRTASKGKEVEIRVNGTKVETPVEDCADRITSDEYATTKIVKLDTSIVKQYNKIEVSWSDGKSGGVGAVVIRAALGKDVPEEEPKDPETGLNSMDINNKLDFYPNPAKEVLYVNNNESGTIQILSLNGKIIQSVETETENTSIPLNDIRQGTYLVRFIGENKVQTGKLIIL